VAAIGISLASFFWRIIVLVKLSLAFTALFASSAFAQNYVVADLVSSAAFNAPAAELGSYYGADLDASLDGRYITFKTFTSLAPGHNGGARQYLKDMDTGQVKLIPNSLYAGPFRMDNVGRFIAYNASSSLYVYDNQSSTSSLIATNINTAPEISPNGRFIIFGRYDYTRSMQVVQIHDLVNKITTTYDPPGLPTVNAIDYLSISDVVVPFEKNSRVRTMPRFALRVYSGSIRTLYVWDEYTGFQALPNGGAQPWPDSEPVLSGDGLRLFFSRRTEVQCANQGVQTTREIYSVPSGVLSTPALRHSARGVGMTSNIAAMPRPSYTGDAVTFYRNGYRPSGFVQEYLTVASVAVASGCDQIAQGISVSGSGVTFDNNYSQSSDQSNTLTPTKLGYVIAPTKSLSSLDPNTAGDRTDYYRSSGFTATICGEKLCLN
jgi:hypothetical protein